MRQIIAQLGFHLKIEYRSWPQIASLLLFMWCIAYVIYRVRPEITPSDFNFIYWIIVLLTSVSVAIRGTAHARSGERLLMYSVVSPSTALIGLILFNAIYMLIVALALYLGLLLLFYPQITLSLDYFLLIIVGSLTIGIVLSFVSAISRYLDGQHTSLSVLSIPLLIPSLMLSQSIGQELLSSGQLETNKFVILLGLAMISAALAIILFPYLWRE